MKSIPFKLCSAFEHFCKAAKLSREWSALVTESRATYGERPQGGFVSGIYSEHFPQAVQERLRYLAHEVTAENEKAYKARPYRTRLATMRALHQHVKRTFGCGYYG